MGTDAMAERGGQTMELMRRKDVPVELTWDLTAIYDDEAKLTADLEKIRQLTDEIEET